MITQYTLGGNMSTYGENRKKRTKKMAPRASKLIRTSVACGVIAATVAVLITRGGGK